MNCSAGSIERLPRTRHELQPGIRTKTTTELRTIATNDNVLFRYERDSIVILHVQQHPNSRTSDLTMRQPTLPLVFSILSILSSAAAQTPAGTAPAAAASPDGFIVPFSSGLPACASKCGPLFDVQGKCAPSAGAVDQNCFCADSRLTVFKNDGTAGVSSVCGALSCTVPADMQAVKNWYTGLCSKNTAATTTASGKGGATQTGTGAGASASTSTSASTPKSAGNSNATWYVSLVDVRMEMQS